MTYVASPSFNDSPAGRAANLDQCLETARRRLNEVSKASEAEKTEVIVSSAVAAGWNESEVRSALSQKDDGLKVDGGQLLQETSASVVPSSSM